MLKALLTASAALAVSLAPAIAQSAEDRATTLRDWRINCADEDPDIRLIYLEDAISSQGGTIARVCIRSGLKSHDAETRALALRGALTLTDTLSLPFDMPMDYENALNETGGDEDALEELEKTWRDALKPYEGWGGMLTFKAEDVDLFSTSSDWTLKMYSGRFDERQAPVTAMATGDGLRIDGVYYGNPVVVNLSIGPNGTLTGDMMFDGEGPFPIVADVL